MTAAAKTPSQRGRASRAKGGKYQRDLARALRPWFPDAVSGRDNGFRSATHTAADEGDLAKAGPGLWWSLKNVDRSSTDPASLIGAWLTEARSKAGTQRIPLVVQKRIGHADPLDSWCWLWLDHLTELTESMPAEGTPVVPVRLAMRDVLVVLSRAGYCRAVEAAS